MSDQDRNSPNNIQYNINQKNDDNKENYQFADN